MNSTITTQFDPMLRTAIISPCTKFRYLLVRRWADGPLLTFVMLNPSTADAKLDDPTVRRCIGYGRAMDMAGVQIVNLYAYRATDPKDLASAGWPVGPHNDAHIIDAVAGGGPVICGWGVSGGVGSTERRDHVLKLIRTYTDPLALDVTANGTPKHPLYLPAASRPFPI